MIRISAAVINWNNRDHIVACLDSLLGQRGVELDVVVLDNGSVDGSCELVRRHFPHLRVIENKGNLGFAAAHNIGYRETAGEWHLVLNSDVVLEPDYMIRLLEYCEGDLRIGAASGKLLRFGNASGQDVLDSVGIQIFESRRVWDQGTAEIDHGQYDEPRRVFGCCGAAALYRRTMLEDLAPSGEIFPEIYFAYYEDVDLAWRMNLANWKCVYVPDAIARHVRGGSTRGSAVTRKLVFRNRYVLIIRNDAHVDLLRNIGPVMKFEVFQFLRVLRYPRLILEVPAVMGAMMRAWGERRRMRRNGRTLFGLAPLSALVSPGAGLSGWIRHSLNTGRVSGTLTVPDRITAKDNPES